MEPLSKFRVDPAPALSPTSDAELVARIRSGDEPAFEIVFRTHAGALCRVAYHYLQSTALAEEVVQDVLLRVWERRAMLDVHESLASYLLAAVRNRALDTAKAARVTARTQTTGWLLGDQAPLGMGAARPSPFEDAEHHELSAALRSAISRLPERCRLVFTLRWEAHLSYSEIADALHISVKAVERHRQRGLRHLAKSLRGFFP